MKRNSLYAVFLIAIAILTGCSTKRPWEYNSTEYVQLCDYHAISIPDGYLRITDEDIKSIINVELSVHDVYEVVVDRAVPSPSDILQIAIDGKTQYYFINEPSDTSSLDALLLTMRVGQSTKYSPNQSISNTITLLGIYRLATAEDENRVLDYYGLSDKTALEQFIRDRAAKEIAYNYIIDEIFNNSTISKVPKGVGRSIELETEKYRNRILQHYKTVADYCAENNVTYDDLIENIASSYYEMMIYKAVLDDAGILVSDEEVENRLAEGDLDLSEEIEAYKQLAEIKVREYLLSLFVD